MQDAVIGSGRHWARLQGCVVGVALSVAFAAPARAAVGDADRWTALLDAIPSLPAAPGEATTRVAVRVVQGYVVVESNDATQRALRRDAEALLEPVAAASRARIEANMRAFNADPKAQQLARDLDAMMPKTEFERMPTPAELRARNPEVAKLVEEVDAQTSGATTVKSPNAIAAYRLELIRGEPRAGRYVMRLRELQQKYARRHADADRAALARSAPPAETARELVSAHHALARDQLAEGSALLLEARTTLRPQFDRMAALAREAERRDAPATELVQAYALLKYHVDLLLAIDRATIEDVGFWASVRPLPPSRPSPYESSLAPEFDLGIVATSPGTTLSYPPRRMRPPPAAPEAR